MRTPVQGLAHARGCLKTGACAVPCLDERMRSAVGGGTGACVLLSRNWRMQRCAETGACVILSPA